MRECAHICWPFCSFFTANNTKYFIHLMNDFTRNWYKKYEIRLYTECMTFDIYSWWYRKQITTATNKLNYMMCVRKVLATCKLRNNETYAEQVFGFNKLSHERDRRFLWFICSNQNVAIAFVQTKFKLVFKFVSTVISLSEIKWLIGLTSHVKGDA